MNLEDMVEKINEELVSLHSGRYYEPEQAKKTAALALMAQFELAKHLSSIKADCKHAKNEQKAIEADCYFKALEGKDKKPSDSWLDNKVVTFDEVKTAKKDYISKEQEADKWDYVNNSLTNAHLLFRAIGNEKHAF
jgi:hypothetical protein